MNWERFLEFGQDNIFGLDIGSSAVKLVEMQKDETGYSVTAAAIVPIESSETDDQSSIEANTIKAIRQCFQSGKANSRLAVCGVSGPEAAVRNFSFPSLPSEELSGAVSLEASQVCPFNVDNCSVDYQLIANDENSSTGILAAATSGLIEHKKKLIRSSSLNCALMDIDGLALLNCFNEYRKADNGQTIAVLNVGNSFTNLAIMASNSLPFVRDIAFAGNDIIEEVAKMNNVPRNTIANLLGKSSAKIEAPAGLDLKESLKKACGKLITDITETLRYYTTQERAAVVEKVFVCGGFSLVEGFVELLDDQLAAKAVTWNPFEKIACEENEQCRSILEKNGPVLAVAAGLAMRLI